MDRSGFAPWRSAAALRDVSQLILPLDPKRAFGRDDFIVADPNREAVAFVDSWPRWPQPMAALYGPPGSGKSHLAAIWAAKADGRIVEAEALNAEMASDAKPLVVENADRAPEHALFAALESCMPLLLTSCRPPAQWEASLPDLSSRFRAMLAFPLWSPDDDLLIRLAGKLFADRQLQVTDTVIARMVHALERSPAAVRDFVARLDEVALSRKCAVSPGLVRETLRQREQIKGS